MPSHRRRACDDVGVKVSTRGDYATRALLSMVLHGDESPTSVKEIAERTGLPQPYLEQILLAVKGAGLVKSKRGVGGGYILARPATDISLADVIVAVDGPIAQRLDSYDHHEGHCIVQDVWVDVSEQMRTALDDITLAELARKTQLGVHPHRGTPEAGATMADAGEARGGRESRESREDREAREGLEDAAPADAPAQGRSGG